MTTMTTHSSRKSQRVYRSPSDPNEPSPFSKSTVKKEPEVDSAADTASSKLMEIDAEDAEAGSILMALKNHTFNTKESSSLTYDEKPLRSNSMSISNLLDSESDASMMPPHISPYHSLSSESKPLFHHNEARRNSVKKGFQICITPRRNSAAAVAAAAAMIDDDYNQHHPRFRRTSFDKYNHQHHTNNNKQRSFRPANTVRFPTTTNSKNTTTKSNIKFKRNTIHIHISYRIHAHRSSLVATRPVYDRYETSPYPSAFRAAPPPQQSSTHHHYHSPHNWSNTSTHPHLQQQQQSSYHYRQQDNTAV